MKKSNRAKRNNSYLLSFMLATIGMMTMYIMMLLSYIFQS